LIDRSRPENIGPILRAFARHAPAVPALPIHIGLRIVGGVAEIIARGGKRGRIPELWDGHTAGRIASPFAGWLAAHGRR
jgi:hypothetical protein